MNLAYATQIQPVDDFACRDDAVCRDSCCLAGICQFGLWPGAQAVSVDVRAGRPVIRDEPALYVVKEGCLKVKPETPDATWVDFRVPGESLGLQGVYYGSPEREIAWATVDTRLCKIPYTNVRRIADAAPGRFATLFKMLAHDASRAHALIARTEKSADARLAEFLLDLAVRMRVPEGRRLKLNMRRRDIAHHLMIAPETLSRALLRLSDKQLITVDRKWIRICRPLTLLRLSGIDRQSAGACRLPAKRSYDRPLEQARLA